MWGWEYQESRGCVAGGQECRKDVSLGLALQLWYKKRKSGELDGRGV